MEQIFIPGSPQTNAHYAPALREGNTVYISGQLPLDSLTRERIGTDVKSQALQCLCNMEKLVMLAGGSRNNIVKTTAYICDIALWDQLNEAYSVFFGTHKPSRSIVAVSALHFDVLVEIEGLAII